MHKMRATRAGTLMATFRSKSSRINVSDACFDGMKSLICFMFVPNCSLLIYLYLGAAPRYHIPDLSFS
jgi:hypothetical protein